VGAMEMNGWDSVYQHRPYHEKQPHPEVQNLHSFFQVHDVRHILDLGCGDGRHLVYLSGLGYQVTGLDRSFWGLRRSKTWLIREEQRFSLACADMVYLPFLSSSFDAVIAIQVMHHNLVQDIRRTIAEVHRILRKDGSFLLSVANFPSAEHWKDVYVEVEPHTFVPGHGIEKGIPHHFFEEEELKEFLLPFVVQRMSVDASTRKHLIALACKGG
jgi:SAM-dependent methyltransferase